MTHTQASYEKFYTDELIRFWDSQKDFASQSYKGREWMNKTLDIWKLNAKQGHMYKAYREAVRRIENEVR